MTDVRQISSQIGKSCTVKGVIDYGAYGNEFGIGTIRRTDTQTCEGCQGHAIPHQGHPAFMYQVGRGMNLSHWPRSAGNCLKTLQVEYIALIQVRLNGQALKI